MTRYVCDWILLADRSAIFREMGNGFRDKRDSFNPTDLLWWVVVAVVVLAVFAIVANHLAKQDKHRTFNSPKALFNALCKAHGLDRASRKLLKQLAIAEEVEPAGRLFLEPARFDLHRLPSHLRQHAPSFAAMHHQLFAAVEETEEQRPTPTAGA